MGRVGTASNSKTANFGRRELDGSERLKKKIGKGFVNIGKKKSGKQEESVVKQPTELMGRGVPWTAVGGLKTGWREKKPRPGGGKGKQKKIK